MIDPLNQAYVKPDEIELDKCNVISPDWRVCRQTFPLKSMHLQQECEARLLKATTAIPLDCSKKITSHNDVTRLRLAHN
jgi:hypothetical protein